MADDATCEPHDVYFEITVIGTAAKVVAIDGASGIEVAVVGPAHAAKRYLKWLAVAKLRARLARRHDEDPLDGLG
jgi:hypothetical protein